MQSALRGPLGLGCGNGPSSAAYRQPPASVLLRQAAKQPNRPIRAAGAAPEVPRAFADDDYESAGPSSGRVLRPRRGRGSAYGGDEQSDERQRRGYDNVPDYRRGRNERGADTDSFGRGRRDAEDSGRGSWEGDRRRRDERGGEGRGDGERRRRFDGDSYGGDGDLRGDGYSRRGPRGDREDRGYGGDRGDRRQREDRAETRDSGEREDRRDRGARGDRGYRGAREDRDYRNEREDRGYRSDRGGRGDRSDRGDRGDWGDREGRGDRGDRRSSQERGGRREGEAADGGWDRRGRGDRERRGRFDDRDEDRRPGRGSSRSLWQGGAQEGAEGAGRRPRAAPGADRLAAGAAAGAAVAAAAAHAAGMAAADAAPEEAPPAPRPPGSRTGNKPLPYDLPIVRPYDGDKGTFFAGSSWRQLGATDEVVAALKTLGIMRPSHIQAQAFPAILGDAAEGRQGRPSHGPGSAYQVQASAVALADQAGSGKTLAYLLPLMQLLRQEELQAGGRVTKPKEPRGIVLAPTIELVQQVQRVARALSGAGLRMRTAAFTGGQPDEKARAASFRTQKDLLAEGVDLLVATPGRLAEHLEAGNLSLAACRVLVMDEVDVLLGERAAFLDQIAPLRAAAPASLRFVLVTATLPQHVFGLLREVWTDLLPVFGPGLHRTAPGLTEELVDCSGGDEVSEESGRKRKLEALKELLGRHRAARTLVFCNKIEGCRDVENFLKREDPKQEKYRVLPYHEAIRDNLRQENMAAFLAPVGKAAQQQQQQQQEGVEGADGQQQGGGEVPLVLVATDRTSRGIDCHYCEHVVLFDFPRDPSEYVRRVGRTARGAGGRGTVSSLVLGRQVPLARDIIERNQKGMPVHSVPA